MKRFLQLAIVFCCMCASMVTYAEDYSMPRGDGFLGTVKVDGDLTFYDSGGPTGGISTYVAGYVKFVPANEGEQLTITFEELDLSGKATLYIYDGDAEFTSYYTSVKDGYLAELSGNNAGQTYVATSGELSVLYHCKGSGSGKGWKATISSGVPKDMSFVSTTSITGLASVNRGSKNQKIFGASVVTDGTKNALTLNELSIDCSALANSKQVKNVRLYKTGNLTDANLVATAETVGDNLVVKDVTLKNKANDFYVVADVLPDASGEIPSVKISSVKVADEARTPLAETGESVAVSNVILMPSEATTFTIDDDAAFYDDGGKDGKISEKFTGQVTFVPATEGNKVKIDFTKLAIFNTSSVGYNDVLKIYNGKEVKEENLVATLLLETNKIVKSTSDDGALTVTLTSVTGVPANGWEATVSQFVPGDMKFKSVTADVVSTDNVVANDKDAQLLMVNMATDNQNNALKAGAVNLKVAEGCDASIISKVKVYYLGETSAFATTKLFGEAAVVDGKVAVNGETVLVEGNNYFAVVADIDEKALNGKKAGLTLESVVIDGNTQTPAEEVSAIRTVNNVCHATKGSHTHVMYDDWTFTDTKSTIYPTKYENENADYIVTFVPSEEGKVALLDFSKFDVQYDDYSWSTKAVFEVYSGKTIAADKIIWKLSSAAEAKTGPGKKLISDSDDGAITIKFNPNTTSSYYTATGWEAKVSQYKDHDMTIDSVKVTQLSVAATGPNSKNEQLLGIKISTNGSLTKRVLKGVKLNLKGSQESLSKVTVLTSGNENDFEKAIEYGSLTELGDGNVTIDGNLTLRTEDNYLWVTFDVAEDAETGKTVDASVVSLITDQGEVAVEDGDPAGERIVKQMFVLKKGDNGVVTVTKPLLLYDDGGPQGNYTINTTSQITFVPGVDDAAVTINTNSFAMGGSRFYLYSGREADPDNLLGTASYFYTTEGPKNLYSHAADGSITIKVETSGIELEGFEVEIGLRQRTDFEVTGVEAEAASSDKVMRGATDAELVKVKVAVEGDKHPLTVDSFKFATDGTTSVSDIAKASLYYTSKSSNFLANKLIASTTDFANGEIVLTPAEPMELSTIGDHYFWLAIDVKGDSEDGNTISAKLASLSIGGVDVAADKVTSTSASRVIKKGFSGEYTIGASSTADYATFKDAVAALAEGVEGAVTFFVEDGTYRENVTIKNIAGTSAEHIIKFVSKSGNRDKVVIEGNGYTTPAYGEHRQGMFNIENTSYVTLESMSFIPNDGQYPYAVLVYDQSRHFTLKNCYLKGKTITSGSSGMSMLRSEAVNEEGKNNDYMTVEDCTVEGGYISLYLGGTTVVALSKERGLVVRNNNIVDPCSKGIYVTAEIDALIENNRVSASLTERTNYDGMDLYRCEGNLIVRNNVVLNQQSAYSVGIYMRECKGNDDAPAMVYNNVVSLTKAPTNSAAGIQMSVECKNLKLLYNTVSVKGTGGYAFYISGQKKNLALKNVTIQNNLIQDFVENGYTMFLNDESFLADMKFATNAYYYADGGKLVKDLANTLSEYETLTGDNSSMVEMADFLSDTDLRLRSAGHLVKAIPLAEVTTDVTGKARSTTAPTMGAYEFAEISTDAPAIADGYPVAGTITESSIDVKTKWTIGGKLYAKMIKSSEDAPNVADMLVEKAVNCAEDTEVTSSFTELSPSTAYKAYFMVESALGVKSAIVASDEITTARLIAPLTLDLTSIYDVINAGASSTIEPAVEGGDAPYTYEWRNQMNEVIGSDAKLTVNPDHTSEYTFTVTSADGQKQKAKTAVYVTGEMVNASFDDNYLRTESYWNGEKAQGDTFYSGSFAFSNYKEPQYDYWEGFAYANSKLNSFTVLSDQYRNAVGGGVDGSDGYAVMYAGSYATPTIDVTNNLDGEIVNGVYVTNTPYAVGSMEKGDGYTKAFKTGDYYKVIFTGYDAEDNTKNVEFMLADYTSENESAHYIVKDWKWVDLSTLGAVTKITMTVMGSQTGIPSYVALDNLGASKPTGVKDVEAGSVNIYPVPTVDILHIDGVAESSSVRVYTVGGQLVGDYQLENGSIDVSSLVSGVYIVQVTAANGVVKKQFVKM